jgi:hypothetical protein
MADQQAANQVYDQWKVQFEQSLLEQQPVAAPKAKAVADLFRDTPFRVFGYAGSIARTLQPFMATPIVVRPLPVLL